MREAHAGITRYEGFRRTLGIAPNILSGRLTALVQSGLLATRPYSLRPPREEYVLTAAGLDFRAVLDALALWGISLRHRIAAEPVASARPTTT